MFRRRCLLALIATPTFAQAYDNGPGNGNTDGWTINFGFAVSDTFTTAGGPLIGLQFGAWLFPGDVLQSVEVLVGTSEYGNDISDQVVTITQSGNCPINTFGYAICTESGNFNASPAAGTYWLTLQNAVVNTGDPVYWDENSGPVFSIGEQCRNNSVRGVHGGILLGRRPCFARLRATHRT